MEHQLTAYDVEQDLSGLICPLPILRTKAAIARMAAGQVLLVTVSSDESAGEIRNFVRQAGHRIRSAEEADDRFRFWIEKRA